MAENGQQEKKKSDEVASWQSPFLASHTHSFVYYFIQQVFTKFLAYKVMFSARDAVVTKCFLPK